MTPVNASGQSSTATKPAVTIHLTASAKSAYLDLRRRAREAEDNNDPRNPDIAAFQFVDDLIRNEIPKNPTNKKFVLHGPLREMFRVVNGRVRVLWAVHGGIVVVVFVSNTPCKDADDQHKLAIWNALQKAGLLGTVMDDLRKAAFVSPDAPLN